MLSTSKFIMDEMSGQFYTAYGNMYQRMSTKPMLEHSWGTGELIDQMAVDRTILAIQDFQDPHRH